MIDAFTTSCRPFVEREQRDDQLRRVAERHVQQAADARPGAVRELLGRAPISAAVGTTPSAEAKKISVAFGAEQVQDDRDRR